MPSGAERVAEFIRSKGISDEIRQFDTSTKNSALAAQALGCTIPEIAKSVVFAGEGVYVVVLCGDKRVDGHKLAAFSGSKLDFAPPDVVRERTGYAVGGVPPFPHESGVRVVPDRSLLRFEHVWAAGGAPNVVFRIRTSDLISTVGAEPADLSLE